MVCWSRCKIGCAMTFLGSWYNTTGGESIMKMEWCTLMDETNKWGLSSISTQRCWLKWKWMSTTSSRWQTICIRTSSTMQWFREPSNNGWQSGIAKTCPLVPFPHLSFTRWSRMGHTLSSRETPWLSTSMCLGSFELHSLLVNLSAISSKANPTLCSVPISLTKLTQSSV